MLARFNTMVFYDRSSGADFCVEEADLLELQDWSSSVPVLACLNLPTRAPPLAMSRPGGRIPTWPELEPPSAGRTGALWSAFEFDQSTPGEWDVGA